MEWFGSYLAVINVLTFLLYGMDKHRAQKGKWRISENTLIIAAVIGGSPGALLAMKVFRHKTRHRKFVWGIPIILILQIGCLWFGLRVIR